ncbi:MAG: hypothetical protein U9N45_07865, partial [Gemmatimonadota bacterium]|nr:hypothetical protein [Gemmatimonadota bacterium]
MKKILFLFITILAFVIVFVTGCNDQGAGLLNTEPASSPALAAVSSDRGPFKVSVMKGDVKVEKELYPVEWDRASHPKSGIVYKFSNKKDILEALAYVCGSPERAKSFLRAVKS